MFKALGYHTISKVLVVLAGYILHFGLGKVLNRYEYGAVGTVIAFCNFYYMFLTNGVRQGISKSLATGRYKGLEVIKKGLTMQIAISLLLAGVNFFLAPFLAQAFGDAGFESYIKMISLLIPFTAIYFALTGGLNGSKMFLAEAIVISVYPMLRLLAIPMQMLDKENKIVMIIIGFTLASLFSAVLAAIFLSRNKKLQEKTDGVEVITNKKILQVSFDFITFFAAITLVLNMDTFFLQYIGKDTGLTGYYTGVHTFSLVPYYLISAFYLVILPYISENYEKGNLQKVREIIANNFNIIFAIVLPITVLISVTAPELLASFYGSEYYVAGNALSILCVGTFLLSSYAVLNVILCGMNCKKLSYIMSFVTVILDAILLFVLIPQDGIVGAATATTVTALVGCIVATIYIVKKVGNIIDIAMTLKNIGLTAVFAGIASILFNRYSFDNLIVLCLVYIALGIAYLVCMVVFKIVDVQVIGKKLKKK